jgi:hypothetical protein
MSSKPNPPEGGGPPPDPTGAFTQEIQHAQVGARVPEKVARGVFSTGAMVLQGPFEFVLDFVLRMNQPQQIVARLILPTALMPSFINALRENLGNYQNKFGTPPAMPMPAQPPRPPSIEEIYEQLKLADEQLSGVYANHVMIVHGPGEFCFEFITNFYPRAAISCRVFLSAAQVPPLLGTLTRAWQQYQQKLTGQPPPQQ